MGDADGEQEILAQIVDELEDCNGLAKFKIASEIIKNDTDLEDLPHEIKKIKEKAKSGIRYDD